MSKIKSKILQLNAIKNNIFFVTPFYGISKMILNHLVFPKIRHYSSINFTLKTVLLILP